MQEIVHLLRHLAPMVAEDHMFCVQTPLHPLILKVATEVGFQQFKRVCISGNSYESAELIIRLPFVQNTNLLTLTDFRYISLPDLPISVDSLVNALVDWLHFEDQDDEIRNSHPRRMYMDLAASTEDNQNDFLNTFWRLLSEVNFL